MLGEIRESDKLSAAYGRNEDSFLISIEIVRDPSLYRDIYCTLECPLDSVNIFIHPVTSVDVAIPQPRVSWRHYSRLETVRYQHSVNPRP